MSSIGERVVAQLRADLAEKRRRAARREAEIVEFPPKLSEQELCRRQAVIDDCWRRNQVARRELEEELARTCCHRGPGDPDWRLR